MALDSQTVGEIAHAVAATMIGISGYCLARCALAMQRIIRDTFEARGMLPPKRQNDRDVIRRLNQTLWLSTLIEQRSPHLFQRFCETGEISRDIWFPDLDDESLKHAFNVAKDVHHKRCKLRVS